MEIETTKNSLWLLLSNVFIKINQVIFFRIKESTFQFILNLEEAHRNKKIIYRVATDQAKKFLTFLYQILNKNRFKIT